MIGPTFAYDDCITNKSRINYYRYAIRLEISTLTIVYWKCVFYYKLN